MTCTSKVFLKTIVIFGPNSSLKCKQVSELRPVQYLDHFLTVLWVVFLAVLHCITNIYHLSLFYVYTLHTLNILHLHKHSCL